MSRIGRMPVALPAGVKVEVNGRTLRVTGPKGTLEETMPPEVSFEQAQGQVVVKRVDESKRARSMHGLARSLLNNMVVGVTEGFQKKLTIVGVGYRAEINGSKLVMNLGYSDPVEFELPEGVTVEVEANTRLTVSGMSKQKVGEVSAEIRACRPPEPYKGKGVRYEDEVVRIKPGKTGVA